MQGSGAFLCLWEGESGASAHSEAGIGEPVGQDSLGILAAEEDVETLIVSQDIPGNMAPEQVEQFSDVARAAVAVRAASGKPVIVVSNISEIGRASCRERVLRLV